MSEGMTSNNADCILQTARDSFLASLQPGERSLFSACSSANQLIKDLENIEAITKARGRYFSALQRVKKLSDSLEPYFDVVGIVVQSHPENAAIAWGAIRLVFQLASNYVTFFEKLAVVCERIAQELPQYETIADLYTQSRSKPSQRLRESLCRVYEDLFMFFQSVARIFTKKDGSNKCKPIVLGVLAWVPFHQRFNHLLEQLGSHRELVKIELQLAQCHDARNEWDAQAEERVQSAQFRLSVANSCETVNRIETIATEMERNLEQKNKEETFHRIKAWLRPPEFSEELERAKNLHEDGTGQWLFYLEKFQNWETAAVPLEYSGGKGSCNENTLWIQGNPGFGKTILAAAAVQEIQTLPDNCVCYFFFRCDTPTFNNATVAYSAILAQILQSRRQDQDLLDKFTFAMNNTSTGEMVASRRELLELLRLCTTSIENCYIVLDGVDECNDSTNLVREALDFTSNSGVKLLVFSRPNVLSLSHAIPESQCLAIGRSNSDDIGVFLSRNLDQLCESRLLPQDANKSQLLDHLATGADGMFLWARLMVSFLNSVALTPARRVRIIMELSFPEGLEHMYARIVDSISQGRELERRLAEWVITLLAYSKRLLTEVEMQESVRVMTTDTQDSDDNFPDFEKTLIITCASLVERAMVPISHSSRRVQCFRFIHQSAYEYLTSAFARQRQSRSGSHSAVGPFIPKIAGNLDIARGCLQYLTYCVPAQPLGGKIGQNALSEDLGNTFRFCNYAALHWADHLKETMSKPPMTSLIHDTSSTQSYRAVFDALARFMSQKFVLMAWIEANYIFNNIPTLEGLGGWENWVEQLLPDYPSEIQSVHKDLPELRQYLTQLHTYWGTKLTESPAILWEEVTAFTPSRLIATTSATRVTSLLVNNPTGDEVSSRYLCKVSEVNSDRSLMGILSIWPPRSYEEYILCSRGTLDPSKLQLTCSGWKAQYETWSIAEESRRTFDLVIPLESDEIWLQMLHSLWHQEAWVMQFPVCISPTIRFFTILRRLYSVDSKLPQSSLFPLDFDCAIRDNWDTKFREELTGVQKRLSHGETWKGLTSLSYYLYYFKISEDGRNLFFMDCQLLNTLSLAVFQIDTTNGLKVSLVKSLRTHLQPGCDSFRTLNIAFHPHKPVLGFSMIRLVALWSYDSDDAGLIEYEMESGLCSPLDVSFSSCGGYFIIGSRLGRPKVLSIPSFSFEAPQEPLKSDHSLQDSGSTDAHRPRHLSPLRQLGRQGTKALHKRNTATAEIIQDRNSVGIRLPRNCANTTNNDGYIELSKLPDWAGIEGTTASVQMPKTKEDMIRIILNKASKRFNHLSKSKPEVEHLPAIVDRQQASLAPLSGRSLRRRLLENGITVYEG